MQWVRPQWGYLQLVAIFASTVPGSGQCDNTDTIPAAFCHHYHGSTWVAFLNIERKYISSYRMLLCLIFGHAISVRLIGWGKVDWCQHKYGGIRKYRHAIMMTSSNGNISRVTGHLCGGTHRSPVNCPHKGQWRGALMFSLICVWINGWVSNRDAGDLRRHRAHYDVTVMYLSY